MMSIRAISASIGKNALRLIVRLNEHIIKFKYANNMIAF